MPPVDGQMNGGSVWRPAGQTQAVLSWLETAERAGLHSGMPRFKDYTAIHSVLPPDTTPCPHAVPHRNWWSVIVPSTLFIRVDVDRWIKLLIIPQFPLIIIASAEGGNVFTFVGLSVCLWTISLKVCRWMVVKVVGPPGLGEKNNRLDFGTDHDPDLHLDPRSIFPTFPTRRDQAFYTSNRITQKLVDECSWDFWRAQSTIK